MDLLQLTYFCNAAETENFTKTAEKYNVPPSNISQTIGRLEKELGIRLFSRAANKIALNKDGLFFYSKIKPALSLIEEGKNGLENLENEIKGEIKILVKTSRRIVTEVIENFKKQYSDVSFAIYHTGSEKNAQYDFIISDRISGGNFFKSKLLLTEKIYIACHKSNPIGKKDRLTSDDIKNERFICMSEGSGMQKVFEEICALERISPYIAIKSDDPFYVKKYLDLDLGIAFVPSVSWKGTFTENIKLIPFGDYSRSTFVFYEDKAFLTRAKRLFLSALEKKFSENDQQLFM